MSLESYLKNLEEQRNRINESENDSCKRNSSLRKPSEPKEQNIPRNINARYDDTKSKSIAYILWVLSFFGCMGFHRFYLNKWGTGLLWFFTGGLGGIGAMFDLFTLGGKVDLYNMRIENREIHRNMDYMINNSNGETNPSPTHNHDISPRNPKDPIVTYVHPKSRNRKTIFIMIAIISVLILAILENPSISRAKEDVNTIIKEKVKENLWLLEKDKSEGNELGTELAIMFASPLIDSYINTKISNYILFSTFEAYCYEIPDPVVSGIIIFGKVIPLHWHLKNSK